MQFNLKIKITGLLVLIALAGCQKEHGTAQVQEQEQASASRPTTQPPVAPAKPSAYDGPFGLKMGLSIEEVKKIIPGLSKTEQSEWIYKADSVPTPHPDFDFYVLNFSEKTGLCKISAIGKDIKSGDSGAEVKSDFNSLDESLSKKYGKGKKYDFTSSKYESPEYWMMYLLKKNRTLAKFWDKETGSTLLNNLEAIELQAKASDMSTGYLVLSYDFENISDCVTESKNNKNKGL